MTKPVEPKCPHCGSTRIRACDSVLMTTEVAEWSFADGKLQATDFSDSGGEVHYDSCAPHDPKRPWDCADCCEMLSNEQLIASLVKKRLKP